jgi:Outer membrane protein beta-barrel domain
MVVKKIKWITGVGILFLFLAAPALAANGNFSLGVHGGWAWSIADEAVSGFPDTEFRNAPVYGGSLLYRFPGGLTLGVSVEHLKMDLKEFGDNFGKIKMTPVMFNILYQGVPYGGRGLTGHGGIGLGVNFNSFDKGSFITDLERANAVNFSIDTDEGFVFSVGGGMDYFFAKNVSMNLDGRFLFGTIDTSWRVSGPGGSARVTDIDRFYIHSFQLLLGMRVWF